METYDLYEELQTKQRHLDLAIKQLRKDATKYAEAERNYKIILRQEVLRLRDEGLAVGIIDKICYGVPKVADARFTRDVTEATYKACQESINSMKLQLRLLENQIQREWGQTSNV